MIFYLICLYINYYIIFYKKQMLFFHSYAIRLNSIILIYIDILFYYN